MPLMPFTDPNAAAAANAGRGLENLANFIYQQQVQKPMAQAQTANMQAQLPMIQGQVQAQDLQNKMAQIAAFPQTLSPIDYDAAANASVSGPTSSLGSGGKAMPTDISVTPSGAPNSSVSATQGGDSGSAGGNPGSSSSSIMQRPNIPITNLSSTAGGAPFQLPPSLGLVAATMGTPSAASQNPPPPNKLPPGTGYQGPTPPASPAVTGEQLRQMSIQDMPAASRQHILGQMRAQSKYPISDEALEGIYTQNQLKALPPVWMQAGAVRTTFGKNGVEGYFQQPPGSQQLPNVDPTGNTSRLPVQVPGERGTIITNPDRLPQKDIKDARDDQAKITQARQVLDSVNAIINSNPDLVGPGDWTMGLNSKGGGSVASAMRTADAKLTGNQSVLAKQNQLKQFLTGQIINTLGDIHIGRMTETELNQFKQLTPDQSAPLENWKAHLARVQQLFQQKYDAIDNVIKSQGLATPPYSPTPGAAAALPPVNPSAPVARPAPVQATNWNDVKNLPPGTPYIGPDGKPYTRGR